MPERVEWIAGTGVLFDSVPLAAGRSRGRDDFLPIEIAVSDFSVADFVIRQDSVVFEVDDGQPAVEPLAPGDRVATTMLHPVGVGLALQVARVGLGVDNFQNRLAGDALKFDVMIVVAKNLTGLMEDPAGGVEPAAEFFDRFKRAEINATGIWIRGDSAAEFLEAGHDCVRLAEDFVARLVGGADGQASIAAKLDEFVFGDWSQTAELDGLVADGVDFFQATGDVGRGFEKIPEGIKLDGYLFEFHRFLC